MFDNNFIKKNKYYFALVLCLANLFSSLIDKGEMSMRLTIVFFLSIAANILCFYFPQEKDKKHRFTVFSLYFGVLVILPAYLAYLFLHIDTKVYYFALVIMTHIYNIAVTILIFTYIMRDLLKSTTITFSSVVGSFVGYLWLGIIGSYFITLIYFIKPQNFYLPRGEKFDATSSLYFSYDCITSFGFSDIIPNSDLMRIIAILMAVLGQFYTIVIVGMILNNYSNRNTNSTNT